MATKDDNLSRSRSLRDRRMQKSMAEKELQLQIKEKKMTKKLEELYHEKDNNKVLLARIAELEYELGKKGERLKKVQLQKKKIQENLKNTLKNRKLYHEKNNQLKNDAIHFLGSLEQELIAFEQKSTIFSENKQLQRQLNKIKINIKNKQNDLMTQNQLLTAQEKNITKKLQKSMTNDESSTNLHSQSTPVTTTPVTDEKDDEKNENENEKANTPLQIDMTQTHMFLLNNSATSPANDHISDFQFAQTETATNNDENKEKDFASQHSQHSMKSKKTKKRYNKLNVKIESHSNIIKRQISIGSSVSASPFKFEEKMLKAQKKKLKKQGNPLKTKISKLEKELNHAKQTIDTLTKEKQELTQQLEQLEQK